MRHPRMCHLPHSAWCVRPFLLFSCSVVSDCLWPHGLYIAHQAPLSMGFPRQEYWNGLPFPSPGDRPKTWVSCVGRWILYHWTAWEAWVRPYDLLYRDVLYYFCIWSCNLILLSGLKALFLPTFLLFFQSAFIPPLFNNLIFPDNHCSCFSMCYSPGFSPLFFLRVYQGPAQIHCFFFFPSCC